MHLSSQQLNHWEEKQETAGQGWSTMRNGFKTKKCVKNDHNLQRFDLETLQIHGKETTSKLNKIWNGSQMPVNDESLKNFFAQKSILVVTKSQVHLQVAIKKKKKREEIKKTTTTTKKSSYYHLY